jgi:hypothetical protein
MDLGLQILISFFDFNARPLRAGGRSVARHAHARWSLPLMARQRLANAIRVDTKSSGGL